MLALPLKKSCEVELVGPLNRCARALSPRPAWSGALTHPRAGRPLSPRRYVEREYGSDEAARHHDDFETLGSLRARALAVSGAATPGGDAARRELLRYARQLRSAEGRIPVGSDETGTAGSGAACVAISFTWFDAFCPAKARARRARRARPHPPLYKHKTRARACAHAPL